MKKYILFIKEFGFRLFLLKLLCKAFKNEYFYRKKHKLIIEILKKRYKDFIDTYEQIYNHLEVKEKPKIGDNIVWVCWWQGIENAPEIVKKCYRKLTSYDLDVRIINQNNYEQYIKFPKYIYDKLKNNNITLIHFSDLIRFNLLSIYGGIWLDSTIYISSYKFFDDVLNKDFFTVKTLNGDYKNISNGRWTGFCIGGKSGNILFNFINDFFVEYWKNEKYLIDYFLIDYIFEIAYEEIPKVKKIIDENEVSNLNVFELVKYLNKQYSQEIFDKITKETMIHKLTYKKAYIDDINSFYNKL